MCLLWYQLCYLHVCRIASVPSIISCCVCGGRFSICCRYPGNLKNFNCLRAFYFMFIGKTFNLILFVVKIVFYKFKGFMVMMYIEIGLFCIQILLRKCKKQLD